MGVKQDVSVCNNTILYKIGDYVWFFYNGKKLCGKVVKLLGLFCVVESVVDDLVMCFVYHQNRLRADTTVSERSRSVRSVSYDVVMQGDCRLNSKTPVW